MATNYNESDITIESASDLNNLLDKQPKRISSDDWHEMLNALPPCRWCTHNGVNMFYLSEAYTLDLHSWYTRDSDGNYFTFMDRNRTSLEQIAKRHIDAVALADQVTEQLS